MRKCKLWRKNNSSRGDRNEANDDDDDDANDANDDENSHWRFRFEDWFQYLSEDDDIELVGQPEMLLASTSASAPTPSPQRPSSPKPRFSSSRRHASTSESNADFNKKPKMKSLRSISAPSTPQSFDASVPSTSQSKGKWNDSNCSSVEDCDHWDIPPKNGNPRKRKRPSTPFDEESTTPKQIQLAVYNKLFYDGMQSNSEFRELLMEHLSQYQLRTWAQISTEWCSSAYSVIRRRFGDKVFTLLWCTVSSHGPLRVTEHYHPSFLALKPVVRPMVGNDKYGYLNNLRQPSPVQTIISFGNQCMEQQLISADDRQDMPHVEVFVYVTGPAIFFTTPDLHNVGDSLRGIFKNNNNNLTDINSSGGDFLSSLCFPQNSSFAIDVRLFLRNENEPFTNGWKFDSRMNTKAILIFTTYDDPTVMAWTKEILNEAFSRGCTSIPFISGEVLFVGTNMMHPGSLTALAISVVGDETTSVLPIEIEKHCHSDQLSPKFKELSNFINGEDSRLNWLPPNHQSPKKSCVALMIGFQALQDSPVGDYSYVMEFMKQFQHDFPSVPIQGIMSDKPFQFQREATFHNVNSTCTNNGLTRTSGIIKDQLFPRTNEGIALLIVKYSPVTQTNIAD